MKCIVVFLTVSCFLLFSCEKPDSASEAAILFAHTLADSSYSEAWDILTPNSQLLYDSTVAVLHEFGWIEVQPAVHSLIGETTEEEFINLTGKTLFVKLISSAPGTHTLSTNVESVTYPTDSLAIVVLNTADGLQEIPVQKIEGVWLINISDLVPAL